MLNYFAHHPSAVEHMQESAAASWPLVFAISLLVSIIILGGTLYFMKMSSELSNVRSQEVKSKK